MIRVAVLMLIAVAASEATGVFLRNPHWVEFKQLHDKSYASIEEETARYFIFMQNLKEIEAHNKEFEAGKTSFSMGMNQFGDMTNEEFKAFMNGFKRPVGASKASREIFVAPNDPLPTEVDWRPKGYVTDIKDQKQCGSCWAFSATGGLEGQHFKQTGKLISLSEQNLVDCSWKQGNEGCGGGWMDSAFQYISDNNGIDTETSYPYEAKNGKCRYNPANVGANDTGFVDIKSGSESDLEAAIANVGPISVAIDASKLSFQFYQTGVYDEPRCKNGEEDLDHGVLAVGYGATNKGEKYYIIKNSWGKSFGDKGYILMSREKNNQCGIATAASYPKVQF